MELGVLGAGILLWIVVMSLIGYAIGNPRGRGGYGVLLGLILGPIGWVITLVLPAEGAKCPECLGSVPSGARKCKHCGSALSRTAVAPDLTKFFVIVNERTEGPFTIQHLRYLLSRKKLNPETLCAREGDAQWVPLGDFL